MSLLGSNEDLSQSPDWWEPNFWRILVRSHQKKIIGALALLLLIYILTYQPPILHPGYRRIDYESSGIEEIFKKSDRVNNEGNVVNCAER
jgi:hypothetical protein